eukprot:4243013-Alexandrium_andersonii.AAC.1
MARIAVSREGGGEKGPGALALAMGPASQLQPSVPNFAPAPGWARGSNGAHPCGVAQVLVPGRVCRQPAAAGAAGDQRRRELQQRRQRQRGGRAGRA